MKTKTLRGRVALWTVAVVSGALIIFGAGTAWNLRRELIENLDKEIKTEATDLLSELHEGKVDHGACMHERDFGQLAFFVEALVDRDTAARRVHGSFVG